MTAYIAVSFSKRSQLDKEVTAIKTALTQWGINPFVFVDEYQFTSEDEHEMMHQALLAIERADLVIAETSEKAIGVGVESGYARGKGKTLIYIRNVSAEHSTTVSGVSNHQIIYSNPDDLRTQLVNLLMSITG